VNNKKIPMQQSSRSILEELNRAIPVKKKEHVVEARGHHIISSAIYFLQILTENYTEEEAEAVTRRFLSSIKNGDPNKFIRSIRKIRESKESGDE
jgi:hypothetical protein